MKKVTAVLLSIVLIFSVFSVAFTSGAASSEPSLETDPVLSFSEMTDEEKNAYIFGLDSKTLDFNLTVARDFLYLITMFEKITSLDLGLFRRLIYKMFATPIEEQTVSNISKEEAAEIYCKAYNATKNFGFYGKEVSKFDSGKVIVDIGSFGMFFGDAFFSKTEKSVELPPYDPSNTYNKCTVTADDIQSVIYEDIDDSYAKIKIVPKQGEGSAESLEKFFNVVSDPGYFLKSSGITWSAGDINSNTKLTNKEGYVCFIYNKTTFLMTSAEYVLFTYLELTHANILTFNDSNFELKYSCKSTFPE